MNNLTKDEIIEIIEEAVEKKINGDIRDLRKEFKTHMAEIKPLMESMVAFKFGRKFILGLCGLIGAIGGAILIIKKLF